jgi:hypothetical protein
MFSRAYEIASQFTLPVITSLRYFDGTVDCLLASLTVLNTEGWALTAAHIFDPFFAYQQHQQELQEFYQGGQTGAPNPAWITHCSYWWGEDGVRDSEFRLLPEGDLAVVRLEPFYPDAISHYPLIKNPASMRAATSLCKLGFPFHQISASFDERTDNFQLAPDALPVPRFPIEGIFTRVIGQGWSGDGRYEIKFIETSTPGLRGQSGGPVFDVDGAVWGIQSQTCHLPLGFSPTVLRDGREVEENQFLNVGWVIHPELLIAFLTDQNIAFAVSG